MSDGRVRYVRNRDVRLAYRVYGDAETTLVWVPNVMSSIDRYDDPAQLLEDIEEEWDGCSVPPKLEAEIREAVGPVDLWERVVLRRFSRSLG